MKLLNKAAMFFVIFVLSGILSYYFNMSFSPEQIRPLYLLNVLQLPENHKIHFSINGFTISSQHTRFFSPYGIETEPPISTEDFINLPLGFIIDKSSDNYILINGKYIFKTYTVPFEQVMYADDSVIWDFKEFEDLLLIIKSTPENQLVPYVFNLNTNTSIRLETFDGQHYLNADYNHVSRSFSIVTLADDVPKPSARVFHYDAQGALYGALSERDQLFFNVYRLHSNVVLIGSNLISCYNINGSKNWDVNISNAYDHIALDGDDFLMIYFSQPAFGASNTLIVTEDSQKRWMDLPWGLSSLQRFEDGFIGVDKHRDIVVFDKIGNASARFHTEDDIYRLYWNRHTPGYFYVLDRFNQFKIYTLNKPVD